MHPFGSGDFNEAMQRQLQQTADIARQQTVLAKRFAALELTRIEGEITVAQARVKVSEATIRQLQLTQQTCSEADTARLNRLIESEILKRPAQYLWVHKRFKTRPPGQPGLY